MWYGLVLTENPGLFNEYRTLLEPGVNSLNSDIASRMLLKELERRASNGWRLFSTLRQADNKRVWSLVDDGGKVNHLEIVTIPDIEALVIFCS